jgi:hypothetical protein
VRCCLVFLKPRNPEPRNPKMSVPFFFAIRELFYVGCLAMKSRTPKFKNAGLTFPFFFSKVCLCCCLGHLNSRSSEPRNPEALVRPSLFSHFGGLLHEMLGHLNSRSPEPRNSEALIPLTFFTISGVVVCGCWTLYSRNPKPQNLDTLVTFCNFGSLYMLLFGYLNSRSPEPQNPDGRVPLSIFPFRRLWCVNV